MAAPVSKKDVSKVSAAALQTFCSECFQKVGVSPEHARITSENLIFANLRGVDSHGVIRMKIYTDRLAAGGIDARARPEVVSETESGGLIDGRNGLGQVAGTRGVGLAIKKASYGGVGCVGVRNSNHFGAAAYYSMMALEEGMIGFAATNAGPSMAPTGGREARLGNNPFAVAVPAQRHIPVVLDMATGAVAWGKIFLAQQEEKKIPLTWALDKEGMPTDDPDRAADGGLIQPAGGYKGYGLSLLMDILTGVLCGSAFSVHVKSVYQDLSNPAGCAHIFAAVRVDTFMPRDQFGRRVDELVDLMQSCPRAPSVERIYVPGEIEDDTQRLRLASGIPLNPVLRDELAALGKKLGVKPPF